MLIPIIGLISNIYNGKWWYYPADVTASWKQWKCIGTHRINTDSSTHNIKTHLKRQETHQMFSHVCRCKKNCIWPGNSCLFVPWSSWKSRFRVKSCYSTSCFSVRNERTPLNIRRFSRLLKRPFPMDSEAPEMPLHFRCFQLVMTSARSSSSHDCTFVIIML